jgi:CheY-like chemotaxis protein/HPt (histidine-containing phosphotransfer) domain-containing protein
MSRVLLAEDNPANRKLALAMLRKLGYAADAVTNGVEAIEAVEGSPYDAVLMDCRMPAMDGFQATAEIRRREDSASRMPIIAMTADAMEGDRQKCLDAGMDDYVSKPVSFESLDAVLQRWVPSADARMSPSSSSSEGPVEEEEHSLDPAIISSLRELQTRREKEWMPRLISMFLEDAASTLERLRQALKLEEQETITERAHALAGTAASFGARRMGRLSGHLKMLGSQGRFESARETMAEIEAEFDRVSEALRAEFPDGNQESG